MPHNSGQAFHHERRHAAPAINCARTSSPSSTTSSARSRRWQKGCGDRLRGQPGTSPTRPRFWATGVRAQPAVLRGVERRLTGRESRTCPRARLASGPTSPPTRPSRPRPSRSEPLPQPTSSSAQDRADGGQQPPCQGGRDATRSPWRRPWTATCRPQASHPSTLAANSSLPEMTKTAGQTTSYLAASPSPGYARRGPRQLVVLLREPVPWPGPSIFQPAAAASSSARPVVGLPYLRQTSAGVLVSHLAPARMRKAGNCPRPRTARFAGRGPSPWSGDAGRGTTAPASVTFTRLSCVSWLGERRATSTSPCTEFQDPVRRSTRRYRRRPCVSWPRQLHHGADHLRRPPTDAFTIYLSAELRERTSAGTTSQHTAPAGASTSKTGPRHPPPSSRSSTCDSK